MMKESEKADRPPRTELVISDQWCSLQAPVRAGLLPDREAIIATDATGFSGPNTAWGNKDPALRATENWEKVLL
jgi:hypothetical protein